MGNAKGNGLPRAFHTLGVAITGNANRRGMGRSFAPLRMTGEGHDDRRGTCTAFFDISYPQTGMKKAPPAAQAELLWLRD